MKDTDLVNLYRALETHTVEGMACVPFFKGATVSISFEQQPLEILAIPTTSGLQIKVTDRRCGHPIRETNILVDWTEDLETNLKIWDVLVAPYVRLTKQLLHL